MTPPVTSAISPAGITYHPALGQVRYQIREIRNDTPDQQVEDTISLMKEYACQDVADASLQSDVMIAKRSGDPITDTWNYLRRNGDRGMQFVRDEETFAPFQDYEWSNPGRWRPMVEALERPELLAKNPNPQGDCDDFCGYGACHLLISGVPCSFVTVAADAEDPSLYSHVYLAAYPDSGPYAGQRIPIDLSHGSYPGWEVKRVYRRREWSVGGDGLGTMLAFGAFMFGAGALLYSARKREGLFA